MIYVPFSFLQCHLLSISFFPFPLSLLPSVLSSPLAVAGAGARVQERHAQTAEESGEEAAWGVLHWEWGCGVDARLPSELGAIWSCFQTAGMHSHVPKSSHMCCTCMTCMICNLQQPRLCIGWTTFCDSFNVHVHVCLRADFLTYVHVHVHILLYLPAIHSMGHSVASPSFIIHRLTLGTHLSHYW